MTDLEHKILESIERQNLAPTPAYMFMAKRSVFWLLALLSIILGGISVAILLFWLNGFLRDGMQVFDEVPLEEVLFSIPVAWLLTMPLFTASAYYGFRQTKRGYRLKPASIISLALAASFMLGGLMQWFEVGTRTHEFLERNLPFYERLTHIPYAEWSRPDQGFLGGHAESMQGNGTLFLTDFHKKVWTVDVSSTSVSLSQSILDEGDVAIRGVRTGTSTFKAEMIGEFD
jgi:hypothetical protein